MNFVRFSTLGCSACQRRGANASRRSTGSRRDKGIRRRGLEVLGSRIEAWKNMQIKENKWKMHEGKNAKMRRDCICDFEGSMEELAAGPAAGEVYKLRTP